MESYRGQEEFEEHLLKEVKSFVGKNFTKANSRHKDELEDIFDKIFFRTLKTHRLLVEISNITGIKGETIEIIARSILRFAYREHDNDVKRIGNQNIRLRSWLRQAQQKPSTHDTHLDKEIECELKTPIKNVSKQRKTPKNKKREKKLVKEIVLPTKVDQLSIQKNSGAQSTTSRDILFYDIPSRYSEEEVVNAIKQLGEVHRIRIKKHYKYQSVRADISLLEDYENSFLKGAWKEKVLIGSNEKNKKIIDIRWFKGDRTVKDIKEKCKWKAYKTVFLAYFKNEDQSNSAITLDGGITDQAWIIHGKRQDGVPKKSSKEDLPKALISTVPNNKKEEQMTTIIMPTTIKDITTEEVVDTVNKYRKNLLNEKQVKMISPPLKDYTSMDNVVRIIEEYREEIMVEHGKVAFNNTIMIESSKEDSAAENIRVGDTKNNNKAKGALTKNVVNDKKDKSVCTKHGEKIVTPVELHEYTKVNADCTKRLPKKSEYPFTLSNRNPFDIGKGSDFTSSSDDEEHIKEVKKRIKKKQGTRSDVEYEESEDGFREVKKERRPWAGKPGSRMGRKKKKGQNKK
ncbi:hypothetical protein GLOIN_2v1875556 [Rhizophagus irregularis DAOM 181602=DAOM 197198]|uniref:Uncharacterized protein n=1 Tax=Rhizophagus irregularis (strain DAOM 181602 / DAOM 197198 / MUCL 43194) TaxID=747089 RepID=A0A2P4Q2T8_RHIID|nr:hypothetical protein GLOIN_2v1875556 [Rhizophagus irregularis DAOM 181602=DAOM 197198]POG71979.1 hypothetical protein GLOIN_2v1875556 [Rhizophagus irregularis DAOM 181602=DAOM 197198]GBC11356.2 hypothetical protein GLOIN_2v1875556 [Rhizophagus irregularis DAOM 181602=DAOM 197198]|eukprot:XP_025178845.1 hypothetical protein GLOIN_2v1875556 [Rhizophagus irregularis DAOM 181602=DAOM 197198]